MVVVGFLGALTDEHHLVHVPAHVRQQAHAKVYLALEETEQRILDVLDGSLHRHQGLRGAISHVDVSTD